MLTWKRSILFFLIMVLQLIPTEKTLGDDFRFIASLDLREEYNDNVFFTDNDQEKDFRTIISPKIELLERTERLDAYLDARLAQNIWAQNDELNELDQFYRGGLEYLLSPKLDVSAEAEYTRDSQIDRDITATGLVQGPSTRKRKRIGFSGNYALSELTSGALSYEYEDEDFENPRRTDFDVHSVNFGLTRDLSDLIPLTSGRAKFGFARYESSPTKLDSYSLTIGGSYGLHETLSIHFDLGARYTRSDFEVSRLEPVIPGGFKLVTEDKQSQQWGGVLQFTVSYAGELTSADFTAFNDLRPASGRSGAARRTSFKLDLGRRFIYELWGKLSAEYFLNKSERGEFSAEDIDSETFRVNPRIRYNFTEDFAIVAGYSYVRVVNHVDDREPDRNLIFVRLYLQFPLIK